MTEILIIDEQPILRLGLSQLFKAEDDLKVVAEIGNSEFSITSIVDTKPDLIILELNMSGQSGLQTLIKLKKTKSNFRIIVFTASNNQSDIHRAINSGADGYLLKSTTPDEFIDKIRKCMSGQLVISSCIQEIVNQALAHRSPENLHPALKDLTDRETDVLRLVATGLSNKAIGTDLGIAEGTVKVHVKRVLAKLNLRSRVEAAIFAHEHSTEI